LKALSLTDFNFDVPSELIAQHPITHRDQSKLLHYNTTTNRTNHHTFSDLPTIIPDHSVLVFNNTKVINARVIAYRKSGAKIECFFLEKIKKNHWVILLKNSKKIQPNEELTVQDHTIKVIEKNGKQANVEIIGHKSDFEFLDHIGTPPLPPYIKTTNPKQHADQYQTIFASEPGAVAAPTASLHFTPSIFAQLKAKNIDIIFITLHVGFGTFSPIESNNIYDHTMHKETYFISKLAAEKLNHAKTEKKYLIAVGTTVTRCLESNIKNNTFSSGQRQTDLYITPGHNFKSIDGMITNFHLPKSTLLMLVAAFVGLEEMHRIYAHAIASEYRFYSFGDAMLLR